MLSTNYIADRYEIIGKIGAGGMSDVYKAKDLTLGRFVAIKVLKAEFSEDINFVTKFRTEAQSAAGLEHPNIVNIYDVGSENGIHYIVMEYVEGITLKTYIEKKGQLSFKEAISIAIQMGRGIEAAHSKNIIHRDIKPQNIIISTEGKVKVTDFGIAKAATSNTIHSDVMGSVHYSSPEQARNGFVDGKSDIYSLGIVMYEMVTGRVPFDGDTTVAVAIQHLQEEMVVPSTYAPNLPISLEKIILKCTQKNPDRRYESISAVLNDLRHALTNPDEDFVVMAPIVNQDKTRIMKDTDLHQIKKETESIRVRGDEIPQNIARPQPPVSHTPHTQPVEEEEDGDEIEDDINPGMEKAITIMGIAAALVIVGIIIFLVVNLFGGFSGKSPDSDESESQTQTGTTMSSESQPESGDSQNTPASSQTPSVESGVQVPSVLGKTLEEAQIILNNKKLGIKENGTTSSDEYEVGQIVSQTPDVDENVEEHTTVLVVVSSGKGSVSIPNVQGKNVTDAESELKSANFEVDKAYDYSDSVQEGFVISQSPEGGSQGKKGDLVTLKISRGKESVTVPDFTKIYADEESARRHLADFVVTVNHAYSDSVDKGIVMGQSIAGGKQVEKGTAITITISDGPEPPQEVQPTTYKFKALIKLPSDTSQVSGADIALYDSAGNLLEQWLGQGISKFGSDGLSLQKNGIFSKTGKLEISWLDLNGDVLNTESQNVSFTPET